MAGHPSHDFADMPVFNIRTAVRTQVTDGAGKGPGGGMKPKRHGTQYVAIGISNLNIAVNGFGNPDDLNPLGEQLLGQKGGIGIGIISAHNDHSIQLQLATRFPR